jgi:hypothetical protein
MQKKHFFFAGAALCLLVAGWGYYQYQKPRAGAAAETAAYILTAEQLYAEYSTAEAAAEQKYGAKVIEVTGVVGDVQQAAQATNILLSAGAATGGVNCSVQNGGSSVAVGQRLTIKGRCAGFLMDVSLVDAVVIAK